MREILRKLQKNNRKGFTLTELLIVIAITGILASFGFIEVTKAQRKLKRTEMDNTAREIFVAAQNHLTSSQTNGIWNASYVKNDGSINIETSEWQNAVDYAFTDYSEDTSVYSTAQTDTKTHAFYDVIYNKTTYAEALTNSNSVLQQLLPYGSIDDTVRTEGSYVIEFDAKTNSIYGVFYTDKGVITSDDLNNLNASRLDATSREQFSLTDSTNSSKKISTAVGYYGGAKAYQNEVNRLKNPVVQVFNDGVDIDGKQPNGITLNNTNALEAVITDPNYIAGAKQTILSITISQKSGTGIKPADATFTVASPSNVTNSEGSLTFNKTEGYPFANVTENYLKNVISTKASSTGGIEYHISLDDITGDFRHFANLFPTFTPGTDITVEATVHYGGQADVFAVSKNANSLFDGTLKDVSSTNVISTSTTGYYSADIRTARHLQNLSQDISGYTGTKNGFTLIGASLTADINWYNQTKDFSNGISYTDDSTNVGYKFAAIVNPTLKYFDGLKADGSNYKLSTFSLASKTYPLLNGGISGLFAKTIVEDTTINNIDLIDFNSYASLQAGSLIGLIDKKIAINNVHVYNSSSDSYGVNTSNRALFGVSSDSMSSGGLIGKIDGAKVDVKYSSASVCVRSGTKSNGAGGLIGFITGSSNVSIDNCYVGGKVLNKTSYGTVDSNNANIAGYYAGGFIGMVETGTVNVANSYTTASVYGSNSAGGFVGTVLQNAGTFTISNVYTANAVAGDNTAYKGLFAGYQYSSYKIVASTASYVLGDLSSLNQIGNGTVVSNTGKLTTVTASDLKKYGTNSSAIPYLNSLGTTYPYRATSDANGNAITHHGDWTVGILSKTTITKYINLKYALNETAEVNYIKANTLFDVYVLNQNPASYVQNWYNYDTNLSEYTYYNTYSLSSASCMGSNGQYICVLNVTDLEPGKYYYVKEKDSGNEYNSLKSRYVQQDAANYFATNWNASTSYPTNYYYPINYSGWYGYGYTTYGIPIYNAAQKTNFSFVNNYTPKLYNGGLYYYEKYGDTYKVHGYSDLGFEYGDGNFTTSASTKIDDDGYILAISDTYFDSSNSWENQIRIDLGYYSGDGGGGNSSLLRDLINNGVLKDVTGTDVATQFSGYHVYALNLEKAYRNSRPYDGESAIKVFYGQNYWWGSTILGNYTINPYFADAANMASSSGSDTYHRLRTSKQLNRILEDSGTNITNGWFSGSAVIHQEMDIDMSSNYAEHLSLNNGNYVINDMRVVYQGDSVSLPDGTTRYPILSGIKNTFIQYLFKGTLKNLTIQANTENLTASQISKVAYDNSYGTVICNLQGTITNVDFDNVKMTNLTVPMVNGSTKYSCVGVIGETVNGASADNVTFTNTDFENINVTADSFGIIGHSGVSLSGITFQGTTWNGGSINGTNIGLIGSVSNGYSINNLIFADTTWRNINLSGDNIGLIASLNAGGVTVNNVQFTNTTWEDVVGTADNYGLIAYAPSGSKIYSTSSTAMAIDGVNWKNVNVKTDRFGLLGTFVGDSNGISIKNVIWDTLNISPETENKYTLDTNQPMNIVALIPNIKGTFTNTSITGVQMKNCAVKATITGIIGDVSGSVNTLTVSDTHIYNDANNTNEISGAACGLIGYIENTGYNTAMNNVTVAKGTTQFGFEMHHLVLNTNYWGAIAYNVGKIDTMTLNDISITDINSSNVASVTAVNNDKNVLLGVIGRNSGAITKLSMDSVAMNNIVVPVMNTNSTVPYYGIIGENRNGTINNKYSNNLVFNKISISDIKTIDANNKTILVSNYGFVGANYEMNSTALVSYITLTNYSSGGYGFIGTNFAGAEINNIKIGTANAPATAAAQYFTAYNAGKITSSVIYFNPYNSKNYYALDNSTGSVTNCTANGYPVNQ